MHLLKRGAEAEIWLKNSRTVIKKRVKKRYRIMQLDKRLREKRTRFEIRLMDKARSAGVKVPKIVRHGKYFFEMEYIKGKQLKQVLNENNYAYFAREAGQILATLHANKIIHGDFTTSNMIVSDDELYIIDFGLGFISTSVEDKATDIRVFEETTKATHPEIFENFVKLVLKEYIKTGENGRKVLSRLEKIRERRRYVQKE
jgi:Kae1-associated kinase Bud32